MTTPAPRASRLAFLRRGPGRLGIIPALLLNLLLCAGARAQTEPAELWTFLAAGAADAIVPAATPDGGVVIVVPDTPSAGRVQKITAEGQLAWEQRLTWQGIGWPVVLNDGAVLVAEGAPTVNVGRLNCYAPDGTLRWRLEAAGAPVTAPTERADGRILIAWTRPETGASHTLLQLSPAGETEAAWDFPQRVGGAGVFLADGQLVLPVGSQVFSMTDTGQMRWATPNRFQQARPPAVAADGTIVVTSFDGWLLLINPDGSFRREHRPGLDMMSPVIGADGTIFVLRTDGKIDVRDRTGELLRQIAPPFFRDILWAQYGPALAEDGRLWLPIRNGQLHAYNALGELVTSWTGGGFSLSGGGPLLRPEGGLVIGFYNRRVTAFGGTGGPMPGAWPLLGGTPARNGRQPVLPLPAAPTALSAIETNNAVRLEWQLPDGLVTTEVWRSSTSHRADAVQVAAFLLGREWTDEFTVAGHEYWYWVRARNAAGLGPDSDPIHVRREPAAVGAFVARLTLSDGPLSAPARGPDGTYYVGTVKGELLAVAADGVLRWRFRTEYSERVGTPMVAEDGRLFFTAVESGIYGLSPEGALLWRLPYRQDHTVPPTVPALDGRGHVWVAGQILPGGLWGLLISMGGELLQTNVLSSDTYGVSSLVVAGDDSYWVGRADRIQRWSGEGSLLWSLGGYQQNRVWPLALDVNAEVLSGASGAASGLSRFASDGRLVWSVGTNAVTSGAVVDGAGTAYFGDAAGWFTAVSRAGEVRWSLAVEAPVSCTPALGEPGLVYVATEAGRLLALDRAAGTERWRLELGSRPQGRLVVSDPDELAVCTTNGVLHRLRLAGGVPADASWPMQGRNAAHHGRLPTPLPELTAPAGVSATEAATNTVVVVSWQPVPGAARYEVYRASTPDLTAAVELRTNVIGATSFTDHFIPADQPHWYWVRAAAPEGPGPWSEPARGSQGTRLWRVPLPGNAFGPPAVGADGTAYVLVRQRSDTRAAVVALARADGSELWQRSLGGTNFLIPSGTFVSPVLSKDGRVFAPGRGVLACLSPTGEVLWEQTGLTNEVSGPMALTDSGLLLYFWGTRLGALRAADGTPLWEQPGYAVDAYGPMVARDGTIWVVRRRGGTLAVHPGGTIKSQLNLNAIQPPALSYSGHLLLTDASPQARLISPDGTSASFTPPVRPVVYALSPAANQFSVVTLTPPPVILPVNTEGQTGTPLPLETDLSPPFSLRDLVVAADGTWLLLGPKEVRVLDAAGTLRAAWLLLSERPVPGAVLGDDGTLYLVESSTVAAYRTGSAPPDPQAWAMLRKDRRHSASWAETLPPADLPTDFRLDPSASVNTAVLRWQSPTNLTWLELWRGDTPDFAQARFFSNLLTTQTNYTDRTRTAGSTAYYWLRGLDLEGQEVGRLGPLASTTATGANLAWTAPLSWSGGGLSLAEDGTLYHLLVELTAYRPDGTVRWQTKEVSGYTGSFPVVAADGTILAWEGRRLFAVNPAGQILWSQELLGFMAAAEVAVSSTGLVTAAGSFGLHALDLAGNKLWAVWDEPFSGVALDADGTVYATTQTSRQLRCFSPDGQLRWAVTNPKAFVRGLALAASGHLLAPGNDKYLRAFNAAGELMSELALAGTPAEPVLSPAVTGVPLLRSKSYPDLLALINPAGEVQGTLELTCAALTATADGAWLVSSQAALHAVESDGRVRWSYNLPATASALSPTVLSPTGRIYFAEGRTLYALDSELRPARAGWWTTRANARRTGQWLPSSAADLRFHHAAWQPDGRLAFEVIGPAGSTIEVQYTTDWTTWSTVETVAGTGSPIPLLVTPTGPAPYGFYRLRIAPGR